VIDLNHPSFERDISDDEDFLVDYSSDSMSSVDLSRSSVIRSSASTPSLRSKDGALPSHMMKMDGAGNVKVVVRVRAFLPRGAQYTYHVVASWVSFTNATYRNRERSRMPH
jgi:hypothetical protein